MTSIEIKYFVCRRGALPIEDGMAWNTEDYPGEKHESERQRIRAGSQEAPGGGWMVCFSPAPEAHVDRRANGNHRRGHLWVRPRGPQKGREDALDTGRRGRSEVEE